MSFTANLPDPDFALRVLAPALVAFTVGLIAAAPNLLFAAREAAEAESHFASAGNRDQLKDAIDKTPFAIAAPQSLADEMNAGRNQLVQKHDEQHRAAEAAWKLRMRWRWARRVATAISATAFVLGVAAPMSLVLSGQRLAPSSASRGP